MIVKDFVKISATDAEVVLPLLVAKIEELERAVSYHIHRGEQLEAENVRLRESIEAMAKKYASEAVNADD